MVEATLAVTDPGVPRSPQQGEGVDQQITLVPGPGLVEQPFVRRIDLGEFGLDGGDGPTRARLTETARPLAVGRHVDELGLEPVDPAHERGQQRAAPPAEVVMTQRQLVDALEHQREPVAGAQHRARPLRSAQHQPRQLTRGHHVQPLVSAGQGDFEPGAQGSGACRGRDQDRDPLRGQAGGDQPLKARGDHPCLARARDAVDDEPRTGVADRLALGPAEVVQQPGADVLRAVIRILLTPLGERAEPRSRRAGDGLIAHL